jgi:hypothetical protein
VEETFTEGCSVAEGGESQAHSCTGMNGGDCGSSRV